MQDSVLTNKLLKFANESVHLQAEPRRFCAPLDASTIGIVARRRNTSCRAENLCYRKRESGERSCPSLECSQLDRCFRRRSKY